MAPPDSSATVPTRYLLARVRANGTTNGIYVVLTCAVVKLFYISSGGPNFNADEAVTGIMARNILAGHQYVFLPGQTYGGTIEQYLQALGYAVLRMPQNLFTLRLTQVGLSSCTCLLVYAIGKRMLANEFQALIAALAYVISPWFNFVWTVASQGFYVVAQTLGCLAVYAALRASTGTHRQAWILLSGLASGLAIWSTVTALYLIVPAAMILAGSAGTSWRDSAVFAATLLAGGLPLIIAFMTKGSLPIPANPEHAISIMSRVRNVTGPILREFLGVSFGHDTGGIPRALQYAVCVVAAIVWIAALTRVLTRLIRFNGRAGRLIRPRFTAVDSLVIVPPIALLFFALSPASAYTGTPRYLLTAYPIFALGLAALLPVRHARLAAGAAVAVLGSLAILLLTFLDQQSQHVYRPPLGDARSAIATLANRHEYGFYADYWTGLPLQYLSYGSLRTSTYGGVERFPSDASYVQSRSYIVYVASTSDDSWAQLAAALKQHGLVGRETRIGTLVIVDNLPAGSTPANLGLQ